ncbi:MAG TPA: hypothetical protein VFI28_07045 [Candidatus Limnocylindrales bacterium]|nr:hypothetical protein [Candidatus Limnocylindrales bacterium]
MPHQPDHTAHDELLISAYVAGGADRADAERARGLLATCTECARLAADLRAITAALPAAAIAPRPRDFRLPATTNSRQPRSLARLWRALRPAGASLATIGIAGLLLAGMTGGEGLSTGRILSTVGNAVGAPAAGQDAYSAGGSTEAPSAAASAAPSAANLPELPATPPASAVDNGVRNGLGSTASGGAGAGPTVGPIPPSPPAAAPSPLVVGSVGLLVVGLALLAASLLVRGRGSPTI